VTRGPVLVGRPAGGTATAKGLASRRGLPLAPVEYHLHGHSPKFCGLRRWSLRAVRSAASIASVGHTLLCRLDDRRATESAAARSTTPPARFDKGARMLGLAYPGGPALERLARDGYPHRVRLPTAKAVAGLDFSFACLKTSLLSSILASSATTPPRADPSSAAYHRAIVQALTERTERALSRDRLLASPLVGCVAPTGRCASAPHAAPPTFHVPPIELFNRQRCDDRNAARSCRRCRTRANLAHRRVRHGRRRLSACRPRLAPRLSPLRRNAKAESSIAPVSPSADPRPLEVETTPSFFRYLERIPVIVIDVDEAFELSLRSDLRAPPRYTLAGS